MEASATAPVSLQEVFALLPEARQARGRRHRQLEGVEEASYLCPANIRKINDPALSPSPLAAWNRDCYSYAFLLRHRICCGRF